MAYANLQAMFKLAQRPSHTISNKQGDEFELKSPAKDALLIVKDCTDCHASLEQKAAKLLVESCNNMVLDVKSTLISGVLEILSCKKVVVNLLEGGQVRNGEWEEWGWRVSSHFAPWSGSCCLSFVGSYSR